MLVAVACAPSGEPIGNTSQASSDDSRDCRPHPDPQVRCRLNRNGGGTNYACPATEAAAAADPSYCRLDSDGGHYDHNGTCYRQIPSGDSRGGNQCCYSGGFDNCTGSYDLVSVASSKNDDGSCSVAVLSACSHCNEDVRPFCEQNCTQRFCQCPTGVTATTDPVACESNPLCVWQPTNCGGSVTDVIPDPASCSLRQYHPEDTRRSWSQHLCTCGAAGDALCPYRAPTLSAPPPRCSDECRAGTRNCEGARILVCRERTAVDRCNEVVLEQDCAATNEVCQATLDGPRCAAAGAPVPPSRDGKSCNTDDDCPQPECGCYVASDNTKFCRYEDDPENRPCF